MNDRRPSLRRHMSVRDRQMLVAAYAPIIAFIAVLIATWIPHSRRHRPQEALR
jgi:hypothetical protein